MSQRKLGRAIVAASTAMLLGLATMSLNSTLAGAEGATSVSSSSQPTTLGTASAATGTTVTATPSTSTAPSGTPSGTNASGTVVSGTTPSGTVPSASAPALTPTAPVAPASADTATAVVPAAPAESAPAPTTRLAAKAAPLAAVEPAATNGLTPVDVHLVLNWDSSTCGTTGTQSLPSVSLAESVQGINPNATFTVTKNADGTFHLKITTNQNLNILGVPGVYEVVKATTGNDKQWDIAVTPKPCSSDLKVEKTLTSPTPVDAGGTVSWSIKVTNLGPNASANATVTDQVPAGITSVTAAGCTVASNLVTCETGTLAKDGSKTFTISGKAPLTGGTCVANTATVTGVSADPVASNDTSTALQVCTKPATITIAKAPGVASGPDANGNYTVTYTVTAENTSKAAGTYSLVDTLAFGPNLVASKISWTGAATGSSATSPATLASGKDLAAGVKDIYNVTVTYSLKDLFQSAGTCAAGTGLKNTISGGLPDTQTGSACVDPIQPKPADVTLTKTAGAVSAVDPDTGTFTAVYTVTLKNAGGSPAKFGAITDTPKFDANLAVDSIAWTGNGQTGNSGTLSSGGTINAGQTLTWTVTVTAHFANPAATISPCGAGTGGLTNAVAVADSKLSTSACSTPPTAPTTGISLVKVAGDVVNANPDLRVNEGDTIPYTFTVKNEGTVTLTGVNVTDPLIANIKCDATTLKPRESTTCRGSYTITQANMDAQKVDNTATATGIPPAGMTAPSATHGISTPLTAIDQIKLTKSTTQQATKVGDVLTYSFLVENKGTSTLTSITLNDTILHQTITLAEPLKPGASITITKDGNGKEFAHTVTQDDIDAYTFNNTAKVTATGVNGKPGDESSQVNPFEPGAASIVLEKTAPAATHDENGDGHASVGDTITYQFKITNNSLVTLHDVKLIDPLVNFDGACDGVTKLGPGASTTCSATYTITQADINAGKVDNMAKATGLDPKNTLVWHDDGKSVPVVAEPSIEIVKKASAVKDTDGNGVDVGDIITYTFTVTNKGNVPLTGVTIDDPRIGYTKNIGTLDVGADPVTVTFDYTLTQSDIDVADHSLKNTASVHGTPPKGDDAKNTSTEVSTDVTAVTEVTLKKSSTITPKEAGKVQAGDTVNYTFRVTNDGKTTLTKLVLTDEKLGLVGDAALVANVVLDPGAHYDFTYPHTLTQAELDSGSLPNTAKVVGSGAAGKDDDTSSDLNEFKVPGSIELVKSHGSLVDANLNGKPDAGDQVAYTFTLTNPSTKTVTGLTLTDVPLGIAAQDLTSALCSTLTLNGKAATSVSSIAPGETVVCTATKLYTTTKANFDAGFVNNDASVTGTDHLGTAITAPGSDQVTLPRVVGYTFTKTGGAINDVNGNKLVDKDDTIVYTFTIINTGNVTLNNVTLTDDLLGIKAGTVLAASIDGGKELVTTRTYKLTQADLDAGTDLVNRASVSATPAGGTAIVKPSEWPTTIPVSNALTLTKVATVNDEVTADKLAQDKETVTYTFTVKNDGNQTINNIAIADAPLVALGGSAIKCDKLTLKPTDVATCTATLEVTQAIVDAGAAGEGVVPNTAKASGTTPQGTLVNSNESPANFSVVTASSLSFSKSATVVDGFSGKIGDGIVYSFKVTNTGLTTVKNVVVVDPILDKVNLSAPCTPTELAPGASAECKAAKFTLTQEMIDAGAIRNTAHATGNNPKGEPVTSNSDTKTVDIPRNGELGMVKSAKIADTNGDGVANVGEKVTYSFTIVNKMNVTLWVSTLTDSMLGLDKAAITSDLCALNPKDFTGELVPGASVTCTLLKPYTVTQDDVDFGDTLVNVASVSGKDPQLNPVEATAKETTRNDTRASMSLKKEATLSDTNGDKVAQAGEKVTFQFTITNTGARTIFDVRVDDPMLTKLGIAVACPVNDLAPGATTVCRSGAYTVTAADEAAGGVRNVAVARGKLAVPGPTGGPGGVVSAPDSTDVTARALPPAKPKPATAADKLPPVRVIVRQLATTGQS